MTRFSSQPSPQASPQPGCLLLVRSTLEIAALMKRRYPAFESSLCEIETEVEQAGQLLLDAASVPLARTALESIRIARIKLEQLDHTQESFVA